MHIHKISVLPHKRDWNFLVGGGFCKTQKFKERYEALLEFPEGQGGGGGLRKNPLCGEGMDIFWNYTIHPTGLKIICHRAVLVNGKQRKVGKETQCNYFVSHLLPLYC